MPSDVGVGLAVGQSMGGPDSVCCIVVTYQPTEDALFGTLRAASVQTDQILVVDNSVSPEAQAAVSRCVNRIRAERLGGRIELTRNKANEGLAKALNAGIEWACGRTFDFALFLDQDSVLEKGVVDLLKLTHSQVVPPFGRVALQAANVEKDSSGLLSTLDHLFYGFYPGHVEPRTCRLAMTSGLFLRLDLFRRIGPFDEGLFLDGCDHDFSLRLRHAGGAIIGVPRARIDHQLGAPTAAVALGLRLILRYQTPDRYYYLTRDSLRVAVRHFLTDPLSCLVIATLAFGRLAVLALAWPRTKPQLESAVGGIRDLLTGRRGERSPATFKHPS